MLKLKDVQVSKNLKHLNNLSQQNSPSHLCTYSLNFLTFGTIQVRFSNAALPLEMVLQESKYTEKCRSVATLLCV